MRLFLYLSCLALPCFASLTEALVNGEKKVDVMLYGDLSSSGNGGYYRNNLLGSSKFVGNAGYINTQIGLEYKSKFFYNFRAKVSFRAAYSIISPNDGSRKDFFNNATTDVLGDSSVAMGASYLEYYDGDTSVKAGRIDVISPWINNLIDGLWVRNGSLGDFMLEGIWAYSYGRVAYYEISPFRSLKDYGWFNFNIHNYISGAKGDMQKATYVTLLLNFMPDVFIGIGARGHGNINLTNNMSLMIDGGFAFSIEDKVDNRSFKTNTFLADIKANLSYRALDVSAGYVLTGSSGMGSLGILGVGGGFDSDISRTFYTNIQPFFIWGGRAIKFGRNANLIYASGKISLFNNNLRLYAAYGITFFNGSPLYGGNATGIIQNELNVFADFKLSNVLSVLAHFSSTNFGKNVPNGIELNGGVRIKF